MVTRIEIVQVQEEIVPEATHLPWLVTHNQVLVHRQQFFMSFWFIWECRLRDLNHLVLKCQTCRMAKQREVKLSYTITKLVIRVLLNRNQPQDWLGNPLVIPQSSAVIPVLDILYSGIFIRILFF
jgi:hypothetical protein